MSKAALNIGDTLIVERGEFSRFIDTLLELKYQVIGPTVREGAIIYEELGSPTGTSRSDGPMIRTAGSIGLKKERTRPFLVLPWAILHRKIFVQDCELGTDGPGNIE